MSHVRARTRLCDACGGHDDRHEPWCMDERTETDRHAGSGIMSALMTVAALYLAIGGLISLAIIWSAGHPSDDWAFVGAFLFLCTYLLWGEVNKS